MSPDEDRQVAKNGNDHQGKNGTTAPTTNGALVTLPPSQQNGQRKRNSTTVPPVMNPLTIINNPNERIVYRLVLTGGPCSGKTTGQARLSTFFENLGWKVYRVPETATTLFSGGIRFPDMTPEEAEKFQENLIKVMIAMERTFFTLANSCKKNCIVICDRGIMDATAYMSKEAWEKVLKTNGWNPVELRDNRYNQIVHLVTSADGAEEYYNVGLGNNPCRTEGIELARELDRRTIEAWVGHPYIDVLDNATDFDTKMRKMISAVCRRIGIEAGDRLKSASRKIKFLVKGPLPSDGAFPPFQDFDVVHDYLITSNPKVQSRLRKRGQNGNWSYQHTVRRSDAGSQLVELRRQISHRDYVTMLSQRSDNHHTVYKVRRCFLWQQTYFQLDIYKVPCNTKCFGLILLETYTTLSVDELKCKLPPFLTIVREVSNESEFSMYNLSMKYSENGTMSPVMANAAAANGVNGGGKRKNSASVKTNKSINIEPVAKTNGVTNGKAPLPATTNGSPYIGDYLVSNGHHFDEPDTIEK